MIGQISERYFRRVFVRVLKVDLDNSLSTLLRLTSVCGHNEYRADSGVFEARQATVRQLVPALEGGSGLDPARLFVQIKMRRKFDWHVVGDFAVFAIVSVGRDGLNESCTNVDAVIHRHLVLVVGKNWRIVIDIEHVDVKSQKSFIAVRRRCPDPQLVRRRFFTVKLLSSLYVEVRYLVSVLRSEKINMPKLAFATLKDLGQSCPWTPVHFASCG